jgi:hypothetical protein
MIVWYSICELCQRPRPSGVLKFIIYDPILKLGDCRRDGAILLRALAAQWLGR